MGPAPEEFDEEGSEEYDEGTGGHDPESFLDRELAIDELCETNQIDTAE